MLKDAKQPPKLDKPKKISSAALKMHQEGEKLVRQGKLTQAISLFRQVLREAQDYLPSQ